MSGSIPIVMAGVSDPLRAGLIGSLARPGGNVTGVSMMSTELSGKRLELLREIAPSVSRVGILWNPTNPVSVVAFRDSEVAAKTLGVRLLSLEVRQPHEMDPALRAAIEGQAGALLLVDDRLFVGLRAQIADFALKHRLPTIYGSTAEAQPARRVWQVGLLDYGSPDAARLAWWRTGEPTPGLSHRTRCRQRCHTGDSGPPCHARGQAGNKLYSHLPLLNGGEYNRRVGPRLVP